jgi:signal transduction histidine kinase
VDLVALAGEAAAGDPAGRTEVVGAPGHARVLGEREALGRAVGNLVRNARRHGPPDGRIVVTVRADGDRALLTVEDEGEGLSAEEAAHAFERFWRGPGASGQGSGLGLAIVRAIAERHDGHVRADGPRFTLDLRRAADDGGAHGSLKDRP